MNIGGVIRNELDWSKMIALGYIQDLTDADLMKRPCPGCNHIKWQLGHLIAGENHHMQTVRAELNCTLPAGFAEKYTSETASVDDPSKFHTKQELMEVFEHQRQATLAIVDSLSESDLDRPIPQHFAPTVGALVTLEAQHWTMHAGQWAVVRRQLGKPPLF